MLESLERILAVLIFQVKNSSSVKHIYFFSNMLSLITCTSQQSKNLFQQRDNALNDTTTFLDDDTTLYDRARNFK